MKNECFYLLILVIKFIKIILNGKTGIRRKFFDKGG